MPGATEAFCFQEKILCGPVASKTNIAVTVVLPEFLTITVYWMASPRTKLFLFWPLPSLVQTRSTITAGVVVACAKAVWAGVIEDCNIATNNRQDTVMVRPSQNKERNILFLLLLLSCKSASYLILSGKACALAAVECVNDLISIRNADVTSSINRLSTNPHSTPRLRTKCVI